MNGFSSRQRRRIRFQANASWKNLYYWIPSPMAATPGICITNYTDKIRDENFILHIPVVNIWISKCGFASDREDESNRPKHKFRKTLKCPVAHKACPKDTGRNAT